MPKNASLRFITELYQIATLHKAQGCLEAVKRGLIKTSGRFEMSKISDELRRKIAEAAKYRRGYCRMPQAILPMPLEIEHILLQAAGGTDDEYNLRLACRACNSYKHAKTRGFDQETNQEIKLFNPRTQIWQEHFEFDSETGEIIGKMACGRATVVGLQMNTEQSINARMLWVEAGWYPPKD